MKKTAWISVVLVAAAVAAGIYWYANRVPATPDQNGGISHNGKPAASGTKPATGQPIKIGCITPLSGEGATYGEATRRGVTLALDKINFAGGINGNQVAVIYED